MTAINTENILHHSCQRRPYSLSLFARTQCERRPYARRVQTVLQKCVCRDDIQCANWSHRYDSHFCIFRGCGYHELEDHHAECEGEDDVGGVWGEAAREEGTVCCLSANQKAPAAREPFVVGSPEGEGCGYCKDCAMY